MSDPSRPAYVVNTCDQWQAYASFRFVGVFTNRRKLNQALNKLLTEERCKWDGPEKRFVSELSLRDLQINLQFVNINEITLNKEE